MSAASSRVFVGNMPWEIDTDEKFMEVLTEATVAARSCKIVIDRETGRPRGFGFVELDNPQDAANAIAVLNNFRAHGRPLRADYAEQRDRNGGNRSGQKKPTVNSQQPTGRNDRRGGRGHGGDW